MKEQKIYIVTSSVEATKFSDFNEINVNLFTNKKDATNDFAYDDDQYIIEATITSIKSDKKVKEERLIEIFLK